MTAEKPSSLREQAEKSLFAVFKWTTLFFAIIVILFTASGFKMLGTAMCNQTGNSLSRELSSDCFVQSMGVHEFQDLKPENQAFRDWTEELTVEGMDIKTSDAVIVLRKPIVFIDIYAGDKVIFSNRSESVFLIPAMKEAAQHDGNTEGFSVAAYLYRNWSFSSYYPIRDNDGLQAGMVKISTDPEFFLLAEFLILAACCFLILVLMYAARYFSRYLAQPIVASLAGLEQQMRALADDQFEQLVLAGVPVESEAVELQSLIEAANIVITKLKSISMHDPLTGIYSRAFFEEQMQSLDSQDSNECLGIIMCDLDNLKVTNDSLGHKAGDYLLCKAAMILKTVVRDDDVVARIGGDEFVIFLHSCTEDDVKQVMERIRDTIARFNVSSNLQLGLSMGYGHGCLNEHAAEDILAEADNQMYMDKGAMVQGMLPLVNLIKEERRDGIANDRKDFSDG